MLCSLHMYVCMFVKVGLKFKVIKKKKKKKLKKKKKKKKRKLNK